MRRSRHSDSNVGDSRYIEFPIIFSIDPQNKVYVNENHDLANARSSSSRADSGLSEAFKGLNV